MVEHGRKEKKQHVWVFVIVVQSLNHVQLSATSWTAVQQSSLSFTISRSLLKLMSIETMILSKHFTLCHPLLLLLPSFPNIRVFSNESALHIRWPKCWSFSIRISPSKEYSGLISIGIDQLDLLAVQWTLKKSSPTPQFKSINSSVFSFLYGPTLTFVHDYQKKHSFHYIDFCQQSLVSTF